MCQYCGDPTHELVGEDDKIVIEINHPFVNGEQKYHQAISVLSKAYKKPEPFSDETLSKEVSPYASVRDLEHESKERVSILLLELFDQIRYRWLNLSKARDDDKPFKLDGRIFINPKTGKPLTKKQWKQIKKDLTRAFGIIYQQEEERIVKVAMALGKLLNQTSVPKAIKSPFSSFNLTSKTASQTLATPPYYSALEFAEQQAGESITDLTNRSFKRVHDTIVEAQKNRTGAQRLERDLFYQFGDMNRDWRMIAETEIANNVNNGQLITEIERQKEKDPKKPVYMKGISAPDACEWCRSRVNNQVVVLLERPPGNGTDTVTRDGKAYTAIWPGKSNVGRRRANWWVAAGAQHPHCRCTWNQHTPGFEKYDKMLDEAMAEASKKWKEEHPVEQAKEDWKRKNKELYDRMKVDDLKARKG